MYTANGTDAALSITQRFFNPRKTSMLSGRPSRIKAPLPLPRKKERKSSSELKVPEACDREEREIALAKDDKTCT
jgi:hypothetical protein